ncbi:MAG: VCBS repeat-containing protein [Planctomycetaceae bacterium]
MRAKRRSATYINSRKRNQHQRGWNAIDLLEDRTLLSSVTGGSGFFHYGGSYGREDSQDIELGDLDGDGDLDALIAKQDAVSEIWLNDGKGFFKKSSRVLPESSDVALGDVDGDGDLDAYFSRSNLLHDGSNDQLWLNNGSGVFTNSGFALSTGESFAAEFGDLDKDGDLDLFINDHVVGSKVWKNDGTGHFTDSLQTLVMPGSGDQKHRSTALGDIDGDGDLDAFVTSSTQVDALFLNNGTGQFTRSQTFDGGRLGNLSGNVVMGDIDHDGDLDAVIAGYHRDVLIYTNTGGVFSPDEKVGFTDASGVALADFNGDGYLDIYRISWTPFNTPPPSDSYQDQVFLNDGTGQFVPVVFVKEVLAGSAVATGDIDNDGDLDAFVANGFKGPDQVWFNGQESFPYKQDFDFGPTEIDSLLINKGLNANVTGAVGDRELLFDGRDGAGLITGLVELGERLPYDFEMAADITSYSTFNAWNNGFLIFDYQNANDFKYAGMFTGQNEWVLGQYNGNWNNRIAVLDLDETGQEIKANTTYRVHLKFDSNAVIMSVDGVQIFDAYFDSGIRQISSAGVASYNAVTGFDNFEMGTDVPAEKTLKFPHEEDFNDGVADSFIFDDKSLWKAVNVQGEQVLRASAAKTNSPLVTLGYVRLTGLPQAFDVSVRMRSVNPPSPGVGWRDGFIIFDYKNDNDFKYAGMFTGQNQWVIGHYQGNWGNRLAQVDWDDTGRHINPGVYYDVRVHLDGESAGLYVNGEFITRPVSPTNVNFGPVGVAVDRAQTWFDDFSRPESPLITSTKTLMMNWCRI